MENQSLPQRSSPHGITLIPSVRAIRIAEKLLDINLLINYKMEGEEIMTWAMELDRLMSFDELEKLPFILDAFKTQQLPYEHHLGIRNFFKVLPCVVKTENGFKILKGIW